MWSRIPVKHWRKTWVSAFCSVQFKGFTTSLLLGFLVGNKAAFFIFKALWKTFGEGLSSTFFFCSVCLSATLSGLCCRPFPYSLDSPLAVLLASPSPTALGALPNFPQSPSPVSPSPCSDVSGAALAWCEPTSPQSIPAWARNHVRPAGSGEPMV